MRLARLNTARCYSTAEVPQVYTRLVPSRATQMLFVDNQGHSCNINLQYNSVAILPKEERKILALYEPQQQQQQLKEQEQQLQQQLQQRDEPQKEEDANVNAKTATTTTSTTTTTAGRKRGVMGSHRKKRGVASSKV